MNKHLKKDDKLGAFIPIPINLLTTKLSSTTLLIYGCILSRGIYSQRNGWYDQQGNVYVRYTAPQLAKDIGRGRSTIKASLKELEEMGLIERRRVGLTITNIYVKVPEECISGQNLDSLGQKVNQGKPVSYTKKGQGLSLSEVRKPGPSKYIDINKELNNKYIVREGESF